MTPHSLGLLPIFLILGLSLLLGLSCSLLSGLTKSCLYTFASRTSELLLTLARELRFGKAIGTRKINKIAFCCHVAGCLALCLGAVYFGLHGQSGWAYACAIVGGVTLPAPLLKLFD